MKGLFIFSYFVLKLNCGLAQDKFVLIKEIDKQVASIELHSKVLANLFVDSSKSNDPFTETFFTNSETASLSKVEFLHINPYVKITYYFVNNEFVKVQAIDKSTSTTFHISNYFKNGRIIYNSHPTIDSDNSGSVSIKKAHGYLLRFNKQNNQ